MIHGITQNYTSYAVHTETYVEEHEGPGICTSLAEILNSNSWKFLSLRESGTTFLGV